MRSLRCRLPLLMLLLAISGGAQAETAFSWESSPRAELLGRGTAWETTAWIAEGAKPGPTVMIVAGVHGNEPAGVAAAEQVLHWPLARGRLVVLPRANVRALRIRKRHTPGIDKADRNLNRNYPRTSDDPPRGDVAPLVWQLVKEHEPDWLLDLHEGYSYHRVDEKSYGHTVIHHPDQPEGVEVARLMAEAADATVAKASQRYVLLRQVTRSTLVRSAADHLGVKTLLLETCYGRGPQSRRIRRHRIMVHVLLARLEMLADEDVVDTLLPPERSEEDGLRVAVYDAEGTGGPGVACVLRQVGALEGARMVRVCPEDVRGGALGAFDLVTFTGGGGSRQGRALGKEGRAQVRAFVKGGGGYVGVCAGAYLALRGFSWGLGILDGKTVSPRWKRGRATLTMALTPQGRVALREPRERVKVGYHNGPVFEPARARDVPDYAVWATFATEKVAGGAPKEVMKGSPAIAAGHYGEGRVVVISPHPEQTKGLDEVLPNAVHWARRRAASPR